MPAATYRPLPRLPRFEPVRAPKTGVMVDRTAVLPPLAFIPAPIFGADLRAMRGSLRQDTLWSNGGEKDEES